MSIATGIPSGIMSGMAKSTTATAESDEKIRENRLRRAAGRQGLALVKSRRRDPRALGYGGYMIVDPQTNAVVAGELDSPRALDLDAVEAWLTS